MYGEGDVWARPPGAKAVPDFETPGFHENPDKDLRTNITVDGMAVRMVSDQGKALMPYGCCTPIGLTAFVEVLRVLMPGGSTMEFNARLQGVFGVLRIVQALFLSAPLLYYQLLVIILIGPSIVRHHHKVIALSAFVSFAVLIIALTSYVLNPATERACRVRGWLIHSKAVLFGCALYFSADVALRALAVSVLGYAMGKYVWFALPLLVLLWILRPCIEHLGTLFASALSPRSGAPLLSDRSDGGYEGQGGHLSSSQLAAHDRAEKRRSAQSRRSRLESFFGALFCCCQSNGCCRKSTHVWLETALKYFAYVVAPPVLDGLGSEPTRLMLEAIVSTIVCIVAAVTGLMPQVPHPQHDPVVVRFVVGLLIWATTLKAAAFLWVFFPAMTGVYPVFGVSMVQWCDCMSWRDEAEDQAERNAMGRQKFMQKAASRGQAGSRRR